MAPARCLISAAYGANFATWLFDNQRPISVSAVTHTNKPEIYPKVDDEATITVRFPKAQLIIQPSWNWPVGRKDMEVYGQTGYLITANRGLSFPRGGHEAGRGRHRSPRRMTMWCAIWSRWCEES
jgi:predicted dehydrogenase